MTVTSFRMVGGRVRGLELHWRRLGLSPQVQREVRKQLRGFGPDPCFPLVRSTGEVEYRPDRPIKDLISVDPVPHLDQRSNPTCKGPDLDWLAGTISTSQSRGYDEGLLVDGDGFLVEGIFSALIVFTPSGPVVPAHPRQLGSTTLQQVTEFFGGLPTRQLRPEGHPMWLLNAFSGVRTTSAEYPVDEINAWLWARADLV
ncbi:hypothetical protein HW450_03775 [Corynebacterium hindlerae]|uniref:Uncharacterized protein n=1 Tax=Corynebacterium hindlerae TaxID=699041 RepID=A0A7G5FGX1_9CORY|nr:hypothetical protein [Corynebacterium hindlerae]QMV85862.1 hypothetical protein HW450_03775 [Corynebacterium hindlerae]